MFHLLGSVCPKPRIVPARPLWCGPRFHQSIAAALLLSTVSFASAGRCAAAFTHPGALVTQEELEFAKSRIAAGQQPWTGALAYMQSRSEASLSYTPAAVPNVWQDGYGSNDVGGWAMMYDARAAYLHAMLWMIKGNAAHAQKSIQIVNAWSSTLQSIGGVNAKLIGAAALIGFENAAELLKHSNSGWSPSSQTQFVNMLRNIGYPLIKDFQPSYNGNWDAIITHAMIDMGVFLDDQAIFDRGVNYYKYGSGNGSLPNYVRPDGTTQETSRDCEHETMGISGLIGSAQTAYHQGVDLYGYLGNRLLIGVEGVASRAYNCGPMPTPYPCWEMAYNYYYGTQGNPMPNTQLVLSKPGVCPEDYGLMTGIGYGTVTIYPYAQSTGAEPVAAGLRLRMRAPVPNPFNPRTTLSFDLAAPARVRIRIYDVAGRLVRQLLDDRLPAGRHGTPWDGRGDDGQAVASGAYLARVEAGGAVQTTRLALIR